jgi:hypothetical protein
MALDIAFAPMALEPKQFNVGDTIRVTFTFRYVVGQATAITLQAVPYRYFMGILDRIGASAGRKELTLAGSAEPQEVQESIDFTLAGIDSGTYGLLVEVMDTNFNARADGVLIVAGAANPFTAMMGPVMMLMMMGMVVPMITEGMGEEEMY